MKTVKSRIIAYLESLRFPVLLGVTAVILLAHVIVPDPFPFVDEVLLALIVALLARLKRRPVKIDSPEPGKQPQDLPKVQ